MPDPVNIGTFGQFQHGGRVYPYRDHCLTLFAQALDQIVPELSRQFWDEFCVLSIKTDEFEDKLFGIDVR